MKKLTSKSEEADIFAHWDERSFMNRLRLIAEHADLFWCMGLISNAEIKVIESMPSDHLNYILSREDQPFFASIDLKKTVETQYHRDKLKAALNAVFL